MICRICGQKNKINSYQFKEMMFGFRDQFEYRECTACGCIQIKEYPKNIDKYYPENYYSYSNFEATKYIRKGIKNSIKRSAGLPALLTINRALKKLNLKYVKKYLPDYLLRLPSHSKLTTNSSILDVGCGNGALLCELYKIGFKKLKGIDPYALKDAKHFNRVHISTEDIFKLTEKFDIIMMHHVLEHMPDQHKVFDQLKKILSPKGTIIIRIPIKNEAWNIYKNNWVQLDAPRHYYIHSINSISNLANMHGFKVQGIYYDSWSFQFWGSEQYEKNIPLRDKNSYAENNSVFSQTQILSWRKQAEEFNTSGRGDQAVIYLMHD